MKIKDYNQMMSHLTRPSTPLERKISEAKIKKNEVIRKNEKRKAYGLPPLPVPETQLKPLIDIEKELEKYEDDFVANRGKQTEALIGTTNKHIKEQINKGNIKKEDLILKADKNGLMTNKARTIALRDSFMAKQFNRALGVNDEPEATPEQVGKLAERLERNRQMTGAKPTNLKDLEARYKKPTAVIKKKKPSKPFKFPEFKIDPVLPASYFKPPPPDPEMIRLEQNFNRMVEESKQPKGLPGILGLKKYE